MLPELMNQMMKGHDMVTKSTAVTFVKDIILDNKTELIAPKNAKKLAQKLVDLYSHNSVTACLQLKMSMVNLYASCFGLLFKILSAFPQTTQQLIQAVVDLPEELEVIKSVNLYEVMKSLPIDALREGGPEGTMLMRQAIPMFFTNRFNSQDQQLKALSDRALKFLKNAAIEATDKEDVAIELECTDPIFDRIHTMFDSNNYDQRIAAGFAIEELCQKMQAYDLGASNAVQANVKAMLSLISGKYFNNKELLVDSFVNVSKLMEGQSPLIGNQEFVDICLKQIAKFKLSNQKYKNKMVEGLIHCLNVNKGKPLEIKEVLQEILSQTTDALVQISSHAGVESDK